jgi:hypothetical protein
MTIHFMEFTSRKAAAAYAATLDGWKIRRPVRLIGSQGKPIWAVVCKQTAAGQYYYLCADGVLR